MAQRKPFDPYTLLTRPKRKSMRQEAPGPVPQPAARSTESVVLVILFFMVLLMGYACGNICGAFR